MSKTKDLLLKFKGYEINGEAELLLWNGDYIKTAMSSVFIPPNELSHNRIKTCINDGGFGCKEIISAKVFIYQIYGEFPHYTQYNRTIKLNKQQCADGTIGIITS